MPSRWSNLLRGFIEIFFGKGITASRALLNETRFSLLLRNGGLSLFSLKSKFAKWIWRYNSEKLTLWRKVIVARYGTTPLNEAWNFLHCYCQGLRVHGNSFWSVAYKWYMVCKVGEYTSFWNDIWLLNIPSLTNFLFYMPLHNRNKLLLKKYG